MKLETLESHPSNQPSENCRYRVSDWLFVKMGTKWICRISENPSERAGASKCFLSREGDSEPDECGSIEPHFIQGTKTKHVFKLFDRKTEDRTSINMREERLRFLTCSCGKPCHWLWHVWRLREPSRETRDKQANTCHHLLGLNNNNNKREEWVDVELNHTLLLCFACSSEAENWKQRQGTPAALATPM